MQKAGVNVWMLTGDKLETARSVGRACRLIKPHMEQYMIELSEDKYKRVADIKFDDNGTDKFDYLRNFENIRKIVVTHV